MSISFDRGNEYYLLESLTKKKNSKLGIINKKI